MESDSQHRHRHHNQTPHIIHPDKPLTQIPPLPLPPQLLPLVPQLRQKIPISGDSTRSPSRILLPILHFPCPSVGGLPQCFAAWKRELSKTAALGKAGSVLDVEDVDDEDEDDCRAGVRSGIS